MAELSFSTIGCEPMKRVPSSRRGRRNNMGIKRKQTSLLIKEQITEQLLQQHLRGWKSNPKFIVENLYVFDWESDMLIKTRSGYWYEVECKISFADFKNDFKHKRQKHELLKMGDEKHRRPNQTSYYISW